MAVAALSKNTNRKYIYEEKLSSLKKKISLYSLEPQGFYHVQSMFGFQQIQKTFKKYSITLKDIRLFQ